MIMKPILYTKLKNILLTMMCKNEMNRFANIHNLS